MTDHLTILLLALAFFFIAAAYSSVGFGGGSSYLAILSIVIPDFLVIKTTALLCNIVVVASGSYLFYKKGFFDSKKFLPLAACSVPAAFFAATIHLSQTLFFIALGSVLVLSGMLLMVQFFIKANDDNTSTVSNSWLLNIFLGGGTGFLSGLVGIGGGILLSPILNLMQWAQAKKIAALASFFIFVNSIAGLLGQVASSHFKVDIKLLIILLLAVFAGGQAGTRLNIHLLKPNMVKGLTGILVIYIGSKLILKHTLAIDI